MRSATGPGIVRTHVPTPRGAETSSASLPAVDPEASEFLGTGGGCVSSVASIGVEALENGAFPSNAAAVANCKGIEAEVGGYPYAFYGNLDYLAKNPADCVYFLRGFHTGQLPPGP